MFDLFTDITNSETVIYFSYELSAAVRILIYIGFEILFHKIKEKYPKIKSIVYFLRVIAVFNFIWFFIEYAEFRTHISIKDLMVNYLNVK